jgi:citrate lyase beta subunit
MQTTFTEEDHQTLLERLHMARSAAPPPLVTGRPARQPVHTVYGGAHLFRAGTARKLGDLALRALEQHAPDATKFAAALGYEHSARQAESLYSRVVEKLRREPVEDFRCDFEDGYGTRRDEEEDGHAVAAAREMARGAAEGLLPPYCGMRVKPLSEELESRCLRTLDLFLTALGGTLPDNFVLNLPKVSSPEQVAVFASAVEGLERRLGLPTGNLVFEVMIETPQAVVNSRGEIALLETVRAGHGRCVAAHIGIYDYTALLGIAGAQSRYQLPAVDLLRLLMQAAFAGTGVWLSDSVTNLMPVGDTAAVHRAWRVHYENVRHSLAMGFYQGWDLHPAQLPARYAAVYAFFTESLEEASDRLRTLVARAAQASLLGNVFDDAAMGQGLLNHFLRAIACGAVREDEVLPLTGLTLDELHTASFPAIIKARLRAGSTPASS